MYQNCSVWREVVHGKSSVPALNVVPRNKNSCTICTCSSHDTLLQALSSLMYFHYNSFGSSSVQVLGLRQYPGILMCCKILVCIHFYTLCKSPANKNMSQSLSELCSPSALLHPRLNIFVFCLLPQQGSVGCCS